LLLFGDVSDIGIILANYVSPVFSTNTDLIGCIQKHQRSPVLGLTQQLKSVKSVYEVSVSCWKLEKFRKSFWKRVDT